MPTLDILKVDFVVCPIYNAFSVKDAYVLHFLMVINTEIGLGVIVPGKYLLSIKNLYLIYWINSFKGKK